ncbi:IgA Peptidase M64 [Bacteroides sp. 519]|uniref:IgA Peptidase M64 n=1 Tax=Bacteroides sp. 519 TaxID=2302937 RepID=UPI0013D50A4D|nr:IgA Peptidase M64 [Bacteroides sp. 519]NDV58695.1 peptidase M64 [Bacteroides sp. 519]
MKHQILSLLLLVITNLSVQAQNFNDSFTSKTLRVDYIFSGNATSQNIFLEGLAELPTWAGRRHHLNELPLKGNGEIVMRNLANKECIYRTSFSSLFQEWILTEEAQSVSKAFENTFLLPYPLHPVEVEITLYDNLQQPTATTTHIVRPDDILIHKKGYSNITPHNYLVKSGTEENCIDVVILAEGYTTEEMDIFRNDALIATESLFGHEPFRAMRNRFNIIAVESPSCDSGVSIPGQNVWKQTAFGSHFDTFYSERYLTTARVKDIHDALAGIPYEHIIILANTEQYGGGGIYNSYTLTTTHNPMFRPVIVHEFGHSFGGLADEYFYEDQDPTAMAYPYEVEPWEQNITTFVDFKSKWEDMLQPGTPIPTPEAKKDKYAVGVYEGGGYATKGVFRPADDCRMRTNSYPAFCPVCQRALEQIINFYTVK